VAPAAGLVLTWAAVVAGQQLAVALASVAMSWLFSQPEIQALVVARVGDEVYARLLLGMLDTVHPTGVSIAGALGDTLASAAPALFVAPLGLPAGSWLGVAFSPESSAVGIQAVDVLVSLVMVFAAAAGLLASYRRSGRGLAGFVLCTAWWRLAALLCLLQGAASLLALSWTDTGGGQMALSMFATKGLHLGSEAYDAAVQQGRMLSFAINLALLDLAASAGLGLMVLVRARSRWMAWRPGRLRLPSPGLRFAIASLAATLLLSVTLRLGGGGGARPGDGPLAESGAAAVEAAAPADAQRQHRVFSAGRTGRGAASAPAKPPTMVAIVRKGGGFEYLVNGRPQGIRGVGYNVMTGSLAPDQRAARYDDDFTAIKAYGANTILGWDEREFDDVLMAAADRHDLGVILPFDLKSSLAYDDPQVRADLLQALRQRVESFKDNPALVMWGLGNEVLHDIGDMRSHRAQAFAGFLIEAADMIHEIDPNHPVVYRDAEDRYAEPVAAALRGKPRPWFVYGMNFFTFRIDDALTRGPTHTWTQPLLVSEFGPAGFQPGERPSLYSKLWSIIRAHHENVLGGAAYVWTTVGPEPLDRNFGLTDGSGKPVDGSISALSNLFLEQQASELAGSTSP